MYSYLGVFLFCPCEISIHFFGKNTELYFAFASGSVAAADHEPEDKMAGGTGIWSADIGHNRNEPADHNAWIVRMG